jgi:hypothetical protein
MQHGAVRRGKVRDKIGTVNFNIIDNSGTRLGYTKRRFLFVQVLHIRKNGKLRAKAYIKDRRHSAGLQITVQVKIAVRETGSYRRGGNGDYPLLLVQGVKERLRIIHNNPRLVGTGMDAVPAADTKIMIYGYLVLYAVVAILYRTRGNTGMAVYAFFFVNPDHRRQLVCVHNSPLTKPIYTIGKE